MTLNISTPHLMRAVCASPPVAMTDVGVTWEWLPVGVWHRLNDPCNTSLVKGGNWRSLDHARRGKWGWKTGITPSAVLLAKLLTENGFPRHSLHCRLCSDCNGWEDHIPGPSHWGVIATKLGELPVELVKDDLWQTWVISLRCDDGRQSGPSSVAIAFSHLDGEIRIRRIQTCSPSSPRVSRLPLGEPSLSPSPPPPPPRQVSITRSSGSTTCAPSIHLSAGKPCALALLLWGRIAASAAFEIGYCNIMAGVSDEQLVCRLCRVSLIEGGICEHLTSESHVDLLMQTMQHLKKTDTLVGPDGVRVQKWEGRCAMIWFNHLTGEVGIDDLVEETSSAQQHLCLGFPTGSGPLCDADQTGLFV